MFRVLSFCPRSCSVLFLACLLAVGSGAANARGLVEEFGISVNSLRALNGELDARMILHLPAGWGFDGYVSAVDDFRLIGLDGFFRFNAGKCIVHRPGDKAGAWCPEIGGYLEQGENTHQGLLSTIRSTFYGGGVVTRLVRRSRFQYAGDRVGLALGVGVRVGRYWNTYRGNLTGPSGSAGYHLYVDLFDLTVYF